MNILSKHKLEDIEPIEHVADVTELLVEDVHVTVTVFLGRTLVIYLIDSVGLISCNLSI